MHTLTDMNKEWGRSNGEAKGGALKQSEGDFEFEVSLSVSKEKPRKKDAASSDPVH